MIIPLILSFGARKISFEENSPLGKVAYEFDDGLKSFDRTSTRESIKFWGVILC